MECIPLQTHRPSQNHSGGSMTGVHFHSVFTQQFLTRLQELRPDLALTILPQPGDTYHYPDEPCRVGFTLPDRDCKFPGMPDRHCTADEAVDEMAAFAAANYDKWSTAVVALYVRRVEYQQVTYFTAELWPGRSRDERDRY